MPRKGWNSLSAAYRARLEKNGITQSDYESGASIQSARGHSQTPERPQSADLVKFPKYTQERDRLISRITTKKHFWFSTAPKWNPKAAADRFKRNPPAIANLRRWADMTKEEWLDAIRSEPDTVAYLGYH